MPNALFLCSGTGSVGKPFRLAGWEVIDVDTDGRVLEQSFRLTYSRGITITHMHGDTLTLYGHHPTAHSTASPERLLRHPGT